MKTIRLFDTLRPWASPQDLTVEDVVASALVRAGVAAAANPGEQGALAAGGTLAGGDLVEVVLQVGARPEARRIRMPKGAAEVAIGAGLAASVGLPIAGGGIPIAAPVFTTPASIQHDGTPAVGEQLVGVDGVANYPIVSRRWLLGSTVLATTKTLTARAGTLVFESVTRAPDGREASSRAEVTVEAATPTPSPGTYGPLGGNLDEPVDYNGSNYFIDRTRLARPYPSSEAFKSYAWRFRSSGGAGVMGDASNYTAGGQPLSLPAGATAAQAILPGIGLDETVDTQLFLFLFNPAVPLVFSAFDMTVISTAAGRVEVEVAKNVGRFITVNVAGLNGTDPNIRFIRKDHEALHAAGEIFTPKTLQRVAEMSAIRFMDMQRTNHTDVVTWNSRLNKVGAATWATYHGLPLEVMVALANKTKRHAYFCIPHLADADYVNQFVTYVIDNLDPTLHVDYELSNEPWNDFPSGLYYKDQAAATGIAGWNQHTYTGYAAGKLAKQITDIYAARGLTSARYSNVWGMFKVGLNFMDDKEVGACWPGGNGLPATGVTKLRDVFQKAATTTYFSGGMGATGINDAGLALIRNWAETNNYADALKQWREGGLLFTPSGEKMGDYFLDTLALTGRNIAWASKRGLITIAYEGGSHMIAPYLWFPADQFPAKNAENNTIRNTVIAFYNRLHAHAGAGTLYAEAVAAFHKLGVVCNFNFRTSGPGGGFGHWGALNTLDDGPSTPRWTALKDYQANPQPALNIPFVDQPGGFRYLRVEGIDTVFSGDLNNSSLNASIAEFEFIGSSGQRLDYGLVAVPELSNKTLEAEKALDNNPATAMNTTSGGTIGNGAKFRWYVDLVVGRFRPTSMRLRTGTDNQRYFAPIAFKVYGTNDPMQAQVDGAGTLMFDVMKGVAPQDGTTFRGYPADGSGLVYPTVLPPL